MTTTSGNKTTVYDPYGNKFSGVINNGQTFLQDGSRLPTGWYAQTNGGLYQMTGNGGVKVDAPSFKQMPQVNRAPASAPASAPAAAPQVDPSYGMMNDLRAQMEAQRAAQQNALNQAMSPDNYQQIYSSVMQNLMPLYNTQKEQIGEAATQQRQLADADAERRGLYNSGVGAVMQNQVSKSEQQMVAQALAQLQAQATELTGQQQNRLLQAIGMQGDWTSSDMNSLLNMLNSDRDYTLGQGKLDLDRLNSDRDYELGRGQLDLGWANSNRDYELGLGNLSLNKQKYMEDTRQFNAELAEKQRQFNADYDFRERSFTEEIRQFEREMGYKWSSLNASMKASSMSASIAQAELAMKKEQWADQQAYNGAQAKLEKLGITGEAYGIVSTLFEKDATRDEAIRAVAMYKDYDNELYNDLLNTINTDWAPAAPTKTTTSTGGGNKVPVTGLVNSDWWKNMGNSFDSSVSKPASETIGNIGNALFKDFMENSTPGKNLKKK